MTLQAPAKLAFLYGARETVWPGIVQSLLAEGGAVRAKLLECDAVVRAKLGWSLEQMSHPDQRWQEHVLEPVLTSVQIALTEGWRALGVEPDVIGARCGGEFAAAHAAGRLSLEGALEVACRLSRLVQEDRVGGGMFSLQMIVPEAEHLKRVSPVPFTIAADNDDRTTVIACGDEELDALQAFLTSRRLPFQKLGLKIAYHHPAVDGWAPMFCGPSETRRPDPSALPLYSATAQGLLGDMADDGRHFWRVIREPALVGPMARAMLGDGYRTFLEVGGFPSLAGMIGEEGRGASGEVHTLASMRRGESFGAVSTEARSVLAELGGCGPVSSARTPDG